jgi:4-amino-4-deoxy-L-arabinose transferase-like glycosyltransferase
VTAETVTTTTAPPRRLRPFRIPTTQPAPAAAPGVATRTDRLLRGGVLVAALAFIACYLAVAFARFNYPYPLEWLEGGVLLHVQRVLHGQPLYGAPSIGFTPFLYTPLYYYVSAGAAWLFGLHLSTLRMVSIGSSLVAFGALGTLVWLETRNRWAAVCAVGVFAATFRLGGAWLDLARVDTLFVALVLVGLVVARQTRTGRVAVLAGLVLAASFFAKQSALLPALAVLPFLWRRERRLAVVYGATFGGTLAAVTLGFDRATGGWFSQYTLRLAGQHALLTGEYVGFWTHDLLRPLLLALVVGGVGLWSVRRGEGGWFWIPVSGGLVLASYSARLHSGGYDNVLLPAYAAVALVVGLGLHALTRPDLTGRRHRAAQVLLAGMLVAFAALIYNPLEQIPSASATQTGDRLVAALAKLPKPVYLPSQSWLLPAAHPGASTTAPSSALDDILRGHIRGSNQTLARALRQLVASRAYASIVVDRPSVFSYLPGSLPWYYCRVGALPKDAILEPWTGTRSAPATVWMPRTPTTACAGTTPAVRLPGPS